MLRLFKKMEKKSFAVISQPNSNLFKSRKKAKLRNNKQ